MPVSIRELTEADDARRAELLNLAAGAPVTVADLRDWRRSEAPERIVLRLGAAAEAGTRELAGYAHALRDLWNPPGLFWLHVVVDPAWRRQGIGGELFAAVHRFAHDHGATHFRAEVRDHLPAGLAFAERQGFCIERHIFESTLDLRDFDEAPFTSNVEAAERAGIRFTSLAELGDTNEARRRLWELNERLGRDVPGWDGSTRPFAAFEQQVCQSSWYRPDAQIIATDGDRWIGLTALGYFETPQPIMWVMMTGVEPAYRGRGIALALKLLGVRCAQRYGAAYLRTNNDSTNAAMLAVNRKLGFRPESGYYRLIARRSELDRVETST